MHGSPTKTHTSPHLPRLLLVEDDLSLRRALGRSLQPRFDVTAIGDVAGAVAHLEAGRFDVVLTDLHLEGASGIELLRLVRARDGDLPVILMTGLPDVDSAIAALDLGALTYIKKPFEIGALDAALGRAAKASVLARAHREGLDAPPDGDAPASGRAALAATFERALDALWLAFQPIVDARTGETMGFEALMRSDEPSMQTPGALLDAAEELGRLRDLGRRVRARAAAALEHDRGDELLFVNVHSADLLDDDLLAPDAPLTRLAGRVVLEITERAAIADVHDASQRAAALRARGFKIAIDDLGAGYAGLTSFATFEPDFVKLDMSLVREIARSPLKRTLVQRVAGLCRDLDMRVVAEGIETPEELACMADLGCEYVQGFLLGRPEKVRRRGVVPR